MGEREDTMGRTYFGKMLRGIMKLLMASFIIGLVSAITIPDLRVGDSVISGYLIKAILQFMIPIYLILSALEDMGVKFAILFIIFASIMGLVAIPLTVAQENTYYSFSPPSCIDYQYSAGLILMCPEDAILEGIEVNFTSYIYNSVTISIDYINDTTRVFTIHFTNKDIGTTTYNIDAGYYNNTYVYGFYVYKKFYDTERNEYYEREFNITGRGWDKYLSSFKFVTFRIKAVTEMIIREDYTGIEEEDWSPPDWWNFPAWIVYLARIMGVLIRGIATGMRLLAEMVIRLATLLPYLLMIIPLHILSAFIYSPTAGVDAVRFYLDIARKIISLVVQIAHAIATVISNIFPT
jgi:hypothetical protein